MLRLNEETSHQLETLTWAFDRPAAEVIRQLMTQAQPRDVPQSWHLATDVVEVLSRQARETYLITNNHFRGQAALNALELRHTLQRAPVRVPPPLLMAYPELRHIAASTPEANA
jgi:hypothetical protein